MVAAVFREINNTITIFTPNVSLDINGEEKDTSQKIIVIAHGKTYAELIKSGKNKVNITKYGITQETINEIRDLLFEVPGKIMHRD